MKTNYNVDKIFSILMEHTFDSLLFHNMQKNTLLCPLFHKYTKNDFMGELNCQVNPMKKQ